MFTFLEVEVDLRRSRLAHRPVMLLRRVDDLQFATHPVPPPPEA